MTHYEDLTPYVYSEPEERLLNVGWLSKGHDYRTGVAPEGLVGTLKRLARDPCNVFRGIHFCELCPSFEEAQEYVCRDGLFLGSGEVRIRPSAGKGYVSPVLVVHYIEVHQYLPPEEFIRAVFSI